MNFKNYFILKNKLYEEIKNNRFDKDFIKSITNEFTKKGFNVSKVSNIFNDYISLDELTDYELIAFCIGTKEFTKKDSFTLKNNFSNNLIQEYESYINQDNIIDKIELNGYLKIDDYNYIGRITYEQIYDYINNGLIIYDKNTQRAGKLRNIGVKGGYIRDISLNTKSVKEISELMMEKKFEENQIILGITLEEDNEPNIKFNCKTDNYGDIIITPEYNDLKHKTVVIVLDGYHRIKSCMEAYIHSGKKIKGGLDVRLVIRTKEEQKRIIYQTFKRSDTDKEHLESYNIDDDYYKFVTYICDNSVILNNNVAETYEDCLVDGKLTYKMLRINVCKKLLNIDVKSLNVKRVLSKKYASIIDELCEEVDINSIKSFAYYLVFAYMIDNKEISYEDVVRVINNNRNEFIEMTNKIKKEVSYNAILSDIKNLRGEE